MTNKQRILQMVNRWPEDISFDKALYHMYVLREVSAGLKDIEEGRVIDHDDLFDELERLCDAEEKQANLVGKGQKKFKGNPTPHRGSGRPKNGPSIHKSAKKIRKSAS